MRATVLSALILWKGFGLAGADAPRTALSDRPVAYWTFDGKKDERLRDRATAGGDLSTTLPAVGFEGKNGELIAKNVGANVNVAGPRPPRYPDFAKDNTAAFFDGQNDRIAIDDPGEKSALDFDRGDAITLEAWVDPVSVANGQQVYVIGKGRTNRKGFARDNQNWSLRLRGEDGTCRVSFLFRDADNRPNAKPEDWHRWTSSSGFSPDSGWHHVAVSYEFGKGASLRGYIDGKLVKGKWDLGGQTDEAPLVDDDQVWIGSSLGGNPNSTFHGRIDEVAIHRTALAAARIRERFRPDESVPRVEKLTLDTLRIGELPRDTVDVTIIEDIPDTRSWSFVVPERAHERFRRPSFAFIGVPRKYDSKGLIVDRSNTFVLRAAARIPFQSGKHRLLLRSFNAARLRMDGKIVAQTRFKSRNADGHEDVPDRPQAAHPELRLLQAGHAETLVELDMKAGEHVVVLEAIVGGKGLRPEIGELSVSVSQEGSPFRILGHGETPTLDDGGWESLAASARRQLRSLESARRESASGDETSYWEKRHVRARRELANRGFGKALTSETVDRLIEDGLRAVDKEPARFIDDSSFLRRLSLDVRGVIPTRAEVREFLADEHRDRRTRWIDRFLDDPCYADHQVAYWQDALAENPGILKPKLNNSGPFRWFIHESFLDNKPLDRFVTELILMEGSQHGGGPAGFALATQNDAPMAAKAHIIGTAFLGVEMKCSRCHDAPFHSNKQKDLFSIAALLRRKPQEVPETSTVPLTQEELADKIVEVTLPPGSKVEPAWPFKKLSPVALPEGVLRNPDDPRARLAALVTSPANERFAQVMVNRLWKRYIGHGFVEPVHDWEDATPSHPELLARLGRELILCGYDAKHMSRLILGTRLYRRATDGNAARPSKPDERLFRGPARRRMTAEQLVDSLFVAAGKPFRAEELNLDIDGRRPVTTFLNLGVPERAWQLATLSNERDRPALAIPVAQSIIDLLGTFGWRETRQDPIPERDHSPNPLQPLVLANGTVGLRITTLSDDSELTRLCLETKPLPALVRDVYLQVLSREPDAEELELFEELLRDGHAKRVRSDGTKAKRRNKQHAVSWSNHLSAEATRIKLELERQARAGDPPTARLEADWRERMEDLVWTLVNSPEFVFVP